MKHLISVFFMFAFYTSTIAQTYEVGPFIGGANYIGDVGSTSYINPNSLVAGAFLNGTEVNVMPLDYRFSMPKSMPMIQNPVI